MTECEKNAGREMTVTQRHAKAWRLVPVSSRVGASVLWSFEVVSSPLLMGCRDAQARAMKYMKAAGVEGTTEATDAKE